MPSLTSTTRPEPKPLAVTLGDPCGIGPETIARAWAEAPEAVRGAFVAGDLGVMRRAMALLPPPQQRPLQAITAPAQALALGPEVLPVLQVLPEPLPVAPGALASDGFHPSAQTYRAWAAAVAAVIGQRGSELAGG